MPDRSQTIPKPTPKRRSATSRYTTTIQFTSPEAYQRFGLLADHLGLTLGKLLDQMVEEKSKKEGLHEEVFSS